MSVSRRAFLTGAAVLGVGAVSACEHSPSAWQSRLLGLAADGTLTYHEPDGYRLPDFGSVGYRGGQQLPTVETVSTVGPIDGDNTAHLQSAIDEVAGMPRGPQGFRGALELRPGTYRIKGTLTLAGNGVVLRGAGDGEDPETNTILRAVGNSPSGRDVIVVGNKGTWDGRVPNTRTKVTDQLVPLGSTSLTVADAGALGEGDAVVIVHPDGPTWLKAIDRGGTEDDTSWKSDDVPVVYLRRIVEVSGNRITIDAPLYQALDRSLTRSYLYRWDEAGLSTDIGVEKLRIDIDADGRKDRKHAANGIRLMNLRDAWVRDCTILHFAKAGIYTTYTTQATVAGCHALDPAAPMRPGYRYNFDAEQGSQQILFTDCHASEGRHSFVANGGSSTSGIVFHRTTATGSRASSEGHRRWSQGLLFDNHQEIRPRVAVTILLGSRGAYGTGHGWSAVNSVAWNTGAAARLVVQRPPTAQNFAIGCRGRVTGNGPVDAPTGYREGTGRPGLEPASLYEAQHAETTR